MADRATISSAESGISGMVRPERLNAMPDTSPIISGFRNVVMKARLSATASPARSLRTISIAMKPTK